MLYTLYRISDGSNIKEKLKHADKIHCLKNYLSVFGHKGLIVFTDNCKEKTITDIKALNVNLIELNGLGNANSFKYILDYAIKNFNSSDYVYFLEDDYLHIEGAKETLLEGLEIADYVTLYDHPDKYVSYKNGGDNDYIIDNGEESKVFLTKSSHWKITNSTTMTFAASVKTLISDYKEWSYYKSKDYEAFQRISGHPLRFITKFQVLKNKTGKNIKVEKKIKNALKFFKNLIIGKNKVLIVSIPGKSTHIEVKYLSPLIDWNSV